MRIKSKAGNFIMTVNEIDADKGELILAGKMGVWQAKTHVNVDELMEMLAQVKISGKVIDFLALFGFRYLRKLIEAEERENGEQ
jgi:hypothetical protein